MAEEPTVNNCTGLQDEQRVVLGMTGPIFPERPRDMAPLERKLPHKRRGEKRGQIGRLSGKLNVDLCRVQTRLKQRMELSFEQRHTEEAELAPRIRCVNPDTQKIPFL